MGTKVTFIEPKKVSVETSQGDNYIIGFHSEQNYMFETQGYAPFVDFLAALFDKFYSGDDSIIMGIITRELMAHGFESVFYYQKDKVKERLHLGERIKELRQQKGIDAKTLAYQAGIDAANLCRIEQGKYAPGFDVLTKIASAMGMRIDFVELKKREVDE